VRRRNAQQEKVVDKSTRRVEVVEEDGCGAEVVVITEVMVRRVIREGRD